MSEEKKLLIEYAEQQHNYYFSSWEKRTKQLAKLHKELEDDRVTILNWRKVLEDLK